jgi:pyruvate dehydrogenase E2 component (dihydrolipoamide acetyltransferase)
LAAWSERGDLTARLIRAMLVGIEVEPVFNAWFDSRHGIRRHQSVNVGIAVDSPDGLLVPVLMNAQDLDPSALRAELDRLIEAARKRTLTVQELRGATITLSNYGMIGGLHATPMVVPPQVAILGAGRIVKRVAAGDDGPEIRPIIPLSLTYDHRAITGGEAARFIMAVVRDLERAS